MKSMIEFITKRLSRTILIILALNVTAGILVIIYLTAFYQEKNMIKEASLAGEDIAHIVYAGIKYPMSVGNNKAVEKQLLDLKEERKDLDVFICDINHKIAFATRQECIDSRVENYISNRSFFESFDESLRTGVRPSNPIDEKVDRNRYITTIHPILNGKECYRCHGAERKVLGGIVVRKSAERNYAAIIDLRNRNMIISILGICTTIALIYIVLNKLVENPLRAFTGKINELTTKIKKGDYSVRVDIKRHDEVGELIESFNHMAEVLEQKNNILKKAHKGLSNANKELEAFAYSVSHDLRAPLRGIDGFSKILLDEYSSNLDGECRHYLSRIRNNTTRMSGLIDDILTLSRASRIELQLREVDLNDTFQNILIDFKDQIDGRELTIKMGELPVLKCDGTLIKTAFSNLISNAVKFTIHQDKPEVIIGFDDSKNATFVKDNGIGFEMQYHDKIFGTFQRLHLQEEYEGTGIGLAIVKRIIERHHGKVWAESEPGKGAIFFVKLPKGG